MRNQSGSVFFYILAAVAMLGALSYVMSRGSGDSASGLQASRIADDIKTQAQLIRSAIIECNLVYQIGYPLDPGTPTDIGVLQCRTDGGGGVQNMFDGTTGRFEPEAPPVFTAGWVYGIDTTPPTTDTVYIELNQATNCTANAGLSSAFQILTSSFTASELTGTVCNGTTARFRLNIVLGS